MESREVVKYGSMEKASEFIIIKKKNDRKNYVHIKCKKKERDVIKISKRKNEIKERKNRNKQRRTGRE